MHNLICIQICPEQLTSPRLHEVLQDEDIAHISLGAKGVGSQGDGSVQILVASEEQQAQVIALLQSKYGYSSFGLTISASRHTEENFD